MNSNNSQQRYDQRLAQFQDYSHQQRDFSSFRPISNPQQNDWLATAPTPKIPFEEEEEEEDEEEGEEEKEEKGGSEPKEEAGGGSVGRRTSTGSASGGLRRTILLDNAAPLPPPPTVTKRGKIVPDTKQQAQQNRLAQSKRKPEVIFSDNFMDSLCGPSEDTATSQTKKSTIIRKKSSATFKSDSKPDTIAELKHSSAAVSPPIGTDGAKKGMPSGYTQRPSSQVPLHQPQNHCHTTLGGPTASQATANSLGKKANITQPPASAAKQKTVKAKVRLSKPRLTGLEGDEEKVEKKASTKTLPEKSSKGSSAQQSPTGTGSAPNFESPLTRIFSATDKFHAQNRPAQPKRKPVEVMFSDNFMDSLCGPSEDTAVSQTKKSKIIRKKLSATFKSDSKPDTVAELKDPSAAVQPTVGADRGKKRVRFSDEFGIELAQTRFFEVEEGERVNVTKMHLSREEIKHFDSQREKIMLHQHHHFGNFSLTDPTLMPPGHTQRPSSQIPLHQQPSHCHTAMAGFPSSLMGSSGSAHLSKFGRGMESFFPWKLVAIDDTISLVVPGSKSQSKNIEATRIRGVMEAICLPEISLPISEIDENEHKQQQNETIDHVTKIIPHEMITESVSSPQVESQQQQPKLGIVEKGEDGKTIKMDHKEGKEEADDQTTTSSGLTHFDIIGMKMKGMDSDDELLEEEDEGEKVLRQMMLLQQRPVEWGAEEEEDERRLSPEPPPFKRFDEEEDPILAITSRSSGSGGNVFAQRQSGGEALGEEAERMEEDGTEAKGGDGGDRMVVIIDDDDEDSPMKVVDDATTIVIPTDMEHGPASPEPEEMDESTDSIQLKEIPTEAMETNEVEEEEEDLDIRVLNCISPSTTTTTSAAVGEGATASAEAAAQQPAVSSVAPSSTTPNEQQQKSAAGIDDLSKVQAFLRKGGALNASLLQRISSMVGSSVAGGGTAQQPSHGQPPPPTSKATEEGASGEVPKVCLSAPTTPSKPAVDQFVGGLSSSSSSVLSVSSSISSCSPLSAVPLSAVAGLRFPPPPHFPAHNQPPQTLFSAFAASGAAAVANTRFPPPTIPMRPIMGSIGGNASFPLPDFSKPPPNFITPSAQIRPIAAASFQTPVIGQPQQQKTDQSPTPNDSPAKAAAKSSDESSSTIASTTDEGKTSNTSPGPPGLDEGGSPPQAPTEQQQEHQQDQPPQGEKELHPLLDKEEARA